MHRFYIEQIKKEGDNIIIDNPQVVKQITKVLKLKVGERIVLFDGSGVEYELGIMSHELGKINCKILGRQKGERETGKNIILYQSLLKLDKFEWVLQKCTELGIKKFVPVLSKNCVRQELSANKTKRFQEILREATEQCGGAVLPVLSDVMSFKDAIMGAFKDKEALNLIVWENEEKNQIRDFTKGNRINLFIGPEGGYDVSEIELAEKHGLILVSLGKRILRAETSSVAASSMLLLNQ